MAEHEKYLDKFKEICIEDEVDIINILEAASQQIWDRFKVQFKDPKLLAVTWYDIYITIMEALKDMETSHKMKNFQINLCDRLEIGFDTVEDEDHEKQGNFCPYIRHINGNKKDDTTVDPTDKAIERAVQWNTDNIIHQKNIIKDISSAVLPKLQQDGVTLGSSEPIMPIFIKTYEVLVSCIKIKRRESKDYQKILNWLSCFTITATEAPILSIEELEPIYKQKCEEGVINKDEVSLEEYNIRFNNGDDYITITPAIADKLDIKNDLDATSPNE